MLLRQKIEQWFQEMYVGFHQSFRREPAAFKACQDVKSQGADPELVSLHQIRGNENWRNEHNLNRSTGIN